MLYSVPLATGECVTQCNVMRRVLGPIYFFFAKVCIYAHCTNLNASDVKQILVKHELYLPIKRCVEAILVGRT
jgi:hypothetical protein